MPAVGKTRKPEEGVSNVPRVEILSPSGFHSNPERGLTRLQIQNPRRNLQRAQEF